MNNIQYYKSAIDATGCISNGWNLIKPNYGMYLGIAVLAAIIYSCLFCISFFLVGPIMGGVYYVLLRDMRGEPVDFAMMFKGFEKFVPLMVIGLVQSVPGIVYQIVDLTFNVSMKLAELGTVGSGSSVDFYQSSGDGTGLAILGGLLVVYLIFIAVFAISASIWAISFAFAIPLAIEHDLGPIDALKLSARGAWSNVGGIIILAILLWLILIAGFLALCIGMLLVLPLITAAFAFAYRQVFPAIDSGPVTYATPPPPTAYGGSFGQGH